MGFGGRGGGRGGFGGRGGGTKRPYSGGDSRGGFDNKRAKFQQDLNPATIVPVGKVSHSTENKIVCKVTLENQVPMFNQPVFLENKTHIGKSDEIFGQLNNVLMSVELNETVKADSIDSKQVVFMDPQKILPKERFLPRDPPDPLEPKVKRSRQSNGGGRGGGFAGRGGRGGFSRGGGNFGNNRGGFGGRGGGGRGGGFGGRGGGFGGGGGGGFGGRGGGFGGRGGGFGGGGGGDGGQRGGFGGRGGGGYGGGGRGNFGGRGGGFRGR